MHWDYFQIPQPSTETKVTYNTKYLIFHCFCVCTHTIDTSVVIHLSTKRAQILLILEVFEENMKIIKRCLNKMQCDSFVF